MKKILLSLIVILLVIIGFMVNSLIQQNKSYHRGLEALEKHYEESKYDDSFTTYLDNHFNNKKEFEFSKRINNEQPIEVRNRECFGYGINEGLISGKWAKDDSPFCISDFNFECVVDGGLSIEGIADESKNKCMNKIIIDCTCWY